MFELFRYFTGHTNNADGSTKFKAGKTKVGDAVDGAIKILTIAVCSLYLDVCAQVCLYACLSVRFKSGML